MNDTRGGMIRVRSFLLDFLLNNKALIILLVLCVGCTFATSSFLNPINIRNVIRQICASTIIGVGFTCVIASGNLDLSVGYMLGMLGVIMGLLSKTAAPFPLVILAGLGAGALCGFLNGIIGIRFKLPLFIVTLATGQIFRGVCYLISNTSPVTGLPPAFKTLGQGYLGPIPIPVYIVIGATVIIYVILNRTAFGRYAVAAGGNRSAARISGINTDFITVAIYVLMGLCTTIAALIMTGRAASAQPAAGQGMEMDAIAAVVIGGTPLQGGKGKVMGTVFGCLIVGVINNALNLSRVDSNWQLIAKGSLILIAVLLDVITQSYFEQKLKKA
jgi:ribose/xylose/arabinose/galactoside ABC-type transport system permease subunit